MQRISPPMGNESLLCLQGEVLLNRELSDQDKCSRDLRIEVPAGPARWTDGQCCLVRKRLRELSRKMMSLELSSGFKDILQESASSLLSCCFCSGFLTNFQTTQKTFPPYHYLSAFMLFLLLWVLLPSLTIIFWLNPLDHQVSSATSRQPSWIPFQVFLSLKLPVFHQRSHLAVSPGNKRMLKTKPFPSYLFDFWHTLYYPGRTL